MTAVFRTVATTQVGASTGPASANKPSGLVEGDLLTLDISYEGGTGITITNTGWTQVRAAEDQSSNNGLKCLWRIATSGDVSGSLPGFTLSSSQKWVAITKRWDTHDATTPIHTSAGANGASGNPDPPAITTTIADTLAVAVYGNKKAGSYTPPSGYTERFDGANTADGLPSVSGASKTLASATTENPGTATASEQETWASITYAIAPAAAGGGQPTRKRFGGVAHTAIGQRNTW